MKIGIVSSFYPGVRFNSQVNHKLYADRHGHYYIFNGTPERDARKYFRKIETLLRYLDLFDWIFWIDDDAYFTNFDIALNGFLAGAGNNDMLICSSPSTKRPFTKINSGAFFLRNTSRSKAFLQRVMGSDLESIRQWWRDSLGLFTGGEQDAFVHLFETEPEFAENHFVRIVEHHQFNNRDFEYDRGLQDHFIVHFAGKVAEKLRAKERFCTRLGINPFIVPDEILNAYQVTWNPETDTSRMEQALVRLGRTVRRRLWRSAF